MDVFNTFPEAVVAGVWELGQVRRGTRRGKEFSNALVLEVIVDEGTYSVTDRSPSVQYEDSDTLVYARATDLPTLDTATLGAGYMWHHIPSDTYYNIREANLGKNQNKGAVEHVEFLLRPTEVLENE